MAILEKRRAVNQLPRFERYQDTRAGDRAAALRGETPITSAIRQLAGTSGYGPMADAQGFNPMGGGMGGRGGAGGAGPIGGGAAGPMGGAGKGGVDKFGNMAGQPKNAVTSALKGSTGAGKTTGATAGKVAGTTAAGTTSKLPGLTSKTAGTIGTAGGAGAKGLTSAGTGTAGAKTLTSTGTGTGKTTGATGGTKSGSGLTSTLTNALTGAALGAGTKFVIDKLTGGSKTTGTAGTTGTTKGATSGTGLTSKTNTLGDTIGKKIVDTGVSKVVDTTKAGTKGVVDTTKAGTKTVVDTTKTGPTSVVKGTGTNVGTPPFVPKSGTGTTKTVGPKSPVTSTTKGTTTTKGAPKTGGAGTKGAAGAVTAKTAADIKAENPELTDEEVQAELDRIRDEEESLGVPEGAEDNGDGTYSVTEDGMVTTYDKDGNIIGMEAAETENGTTGDDTGTDVDNLDTTTGDEATTTQVLDDGTVVTLDANGEVVSYTDTDGITYDADGVVIDESDNTILNDGLFSDDEGNLYDADGVLVQYADGTYPDESEGDVAYTDEYGNTYDANGLLIAEGDHSDYVQYDDEGNSYDWDGQLIAYADGTEYNPDDEYTSDDEYTADDEYSADDEYAYDDSGDYDVKKGGLIHMADGGDTPDDEEEEDGEPVSEEENEDGTITQYFDDGSSITYDADGEVVNVTEATEEPAFTPRGITVGANGQRYSNPQTAAEYQAESRLTGADPTRLQAFLDDIPTTNAVAGGGGSTLNQERTRNDALPLLPLTSVDINRPAMYTPPKGWPAGFADNFDGTATYVDDDGSTVTIDEDNNIVFVTDANGDIVAQDNEPVQTTGGLTQAGQGNRQYFDDGSSIETFDDGSQVIYDNDGNVFKTVDAYETTYDDEGNAIVTDGYGNIVNVYDPQGNVIPLGGGRVTGPTSITGGGGGGGTDITRDPTRQEQIAANRANKETESAIADLLAGLNTYGGAGAAGAVLGALLGNTDLFGGSTSGGGGGGFNMEGVGAINPRTTDFGIGPANYVGYDEYGTPEQMPELYGRELYQNLNAPGFNEVNPGDYARYDAEEFGPDPLYEEPMDEEQGMADGGMPQGGLGQTAPQTYYTFGTPVDPLQNLRNPAPFQQQQPPMQSQMPPQAAQNAQQMPPQQALPQMGMAPQQPSIPQGVPPAGVGMKSGGLPAWSNVPVTNGRLNFRQGAAVHGAGDGQSDDIPAMLADGEYVIDAETVAQIGNGSTKAGAQALDKFRENIRMHKRSAPVNKIPPKTKALTSYLKGAR